MLAARALYETLQRLERDGLIGEARAPEGLDASPSSRWRFYQATTLERQVLAAEIDRLESDLAAARTRLAARG